MTLERMKKIREIHGLSYQSISEKSGVPLSTVQKVFGGVTHPREATLLKLSKVFEKYENDDFGRADIEEVLHRYAESYIDHYGMYDMVMENHLFGDDHKGVVNGTSALGKKRNGEYTINDLGGLPDDARVELIDGYIYYMAAPSKIHQTILFEVSMQLGQAIRKNKGKCKVYIAPCAVQLNKDNKTLVEPDIFILCNKDMQQIKDRTIGAPDLVIEILSESTRKKDTIIKLNKYMEAGVREYWIIDPTKKCIVVYHFEKQEYTQIYSFDSSVPVGIYDGKISVDFEAIRQELADIYGEA